MAEFIDLQADVNTTNSEFEEEVNYEKDEISSLIDDLFVDDNDHCFYYQLQNEIKTADEAIMMKQLVTKYLIIVKNG